MIVTIDTMAGEGVEHFFTGEVKIGVICDVYGHFYIEGSCSRCEKPTPADVGDGQ